MIECNTLMAIAKVTLIYSISFSFQVFMLLLQSLLSCGPIFALNSEKTYQAQPHYL